MTENRFASLDAPAEAAAERSGSENAAGQRSPDCPASPAPSLIPFDPVVLRHRADGWTPGKQREYVEALADTGVVRAAAARVGMTEQSVNRLRRRADARGFHLACEAAMRHGARRLRAVAYERAIEGVIKQHFYHGELKGEERVYDNRLLTYLLGKTEHLLDDDHEVVEVARAWEPWVEAIEQGLPPPDLPEPEDEWAGLGLDEPEPEPEPKPEPVSEFADQIVVWERDGRWWTDFPAPEGFCGEEVGETGWPGYERALSPAEDAANAAEMARYEAEARAENIARRDRFFGFAGGNGEGELFPPREAELYEPSAEAAHE